MVYQNVCQKKKAAWNELQAANKKQILKGKVLLKVIDYNWFNRNFLRIIRNILRIIFSS